MIGDQPDGTFIVEKRKKCLSITQVNRLLSCGIAYEKQYLLHLPQPIGLSLLVGSSVDVSVTRNLEAKMKRGALLSLEEVEQLANDEFSRRLNETGSDNILLKKDEREIGLRESINEARAKSRRLARIHAIQLAPTIEPIYLQRHLGAVLDGYPFDVSGVIDIQELTRIIDTKVKGTTPPKAVADDDDQLTQYALLALHNDGCIPEELCLDCCVDLKTPYARRWTTTREESDLVVMMRRLEAAAIVIEMGDYYRTANPRLEVGLFLPAKQSDFWCGEYQCGYWRNCKFVRHPKQFSIPVPLDGKTGTEAEQNKDADIKKVVEETNKAIEDDPFGRFFN